MTSQVLSRPTIDDVIRAEKKFDEENGAVEWLLTRLFKQYPENTDVDQVLLKTKVLNLLYSTQIRAVNVVAKHITGLGIDPYLSAGAPEVVDLIAKVKLGEKIRNNFSFASKYCSWHNPTAYPIYDGNVDACLWHYKKQDSFIAFPRNGYSYPDFVRIMIAFRDFYGLTLFSFKQLDKFLWYRGETLLTRDNGNVNDYQGSSK